LLGETPFIDILIALSASFKLQQSADFARNAAADFTYLMENTSDELRQALGGLEQRK